MQHALTCSQCVRFPKKVNSRTNIIEKEAEEEMHEILLHWPEMVMQSDIWDDVILQNLATNKVSDGDLDKRRQKVCAYCSSICLFVCLFVCSFVCLKLSSQRRKFRSHFNLYCHVTTLKLYMTA